MIRQAILRWARAREPDFIIGGAERPYLLRWWLTPWSRCYRHLPKGHKKTLWQEFVTRLPGIYVHCFKRSDDDRAHHGHPWLYNVTWVLDNEYTEHQILAGGLLLRTIRKAGMWKVRWGAAPHRVELHAGDCWTLFFTGPRIRDWGFYCMEKGFIPWQRFTAADDPGAIGKGCDA